ncbi:Putative cyclic-di-GMP phosphodiesterase YjcC [Thalassocella blandensis]|nr:Putative cyclic-di-GMP phosphodiesterase YjcC [Thalassocella blandensis]
MMKNAPLTELMVNAIDSDDTSLPELINELLSTLRVHLGMDVVFISEFKDQERIFRFADAKSKDSPVEAGLCSTLDESYCKKIVDGELPNIIPDTLENTTTKSMAVTKNLGIRSYMGVPITLTNGKLYGTLCCFKTEPDASLIKKDITILRAFAELAGKRIERLKQSAMEEEKAKARILSVLNNSQLNMVYQPILDLNGDKITKFESLSRFTVEPYRTPDVWFSEAAKIGLGEVLEMHALKLALSDMDKLPENVALSLNTSQHNVINGKIAEALQNVDASRVVLEITEHEIISDYSALKKSLDSLRRQGVRLAIDDAGAGYSTFQHILELNADIIKLDISLIQNIHLDKNKNALAKALIVFAKAMGSEIIAEGIENEEELNECRKLGIHKVQGYYIGRPLPLAESLKIIEKHRGMH